MGFEPAPALIKAGTKEIFLSTAVRLFRRLEAAGQDATLDIYEGMWHIFQPNPIPAADVAVRKSAEMVVYPAQDQSGEMQPADQRACYDWASQGTGWDPHQAYGESSHGHPRRRRERGRR